MSPRSLTNFRKPCGRKGCSNQVKRKDTTYCSRRCGFSAIRKIVINEGKAERPKVEASSWWTDPTLDFYAEARTRFPYEPVTFHQHGWGS